MSNIMIYFIGFLIFFSSLNEKLEFLIQNEELLLGLCFISFIFFAYNFLHSGASESFHKRAAGFETNLIQTLYEEYIVILKVIKVLSSFSKLSAGLNPIKSIYDFYINVKLNIFFKGVVFQCLSSANQKVDLFLSLEKEFLAYYAENSIKFLMTPFIVNKGNFSIKFFANGIWPSLNIRPVCLLDTIYYIKKYNQ